jgi:hypothetical protein
LQTADNGKVEMGTMNMDGDSGTMLYSQSGMSADDGTMVYTGGVDDGTMVYNGGSSTMVYSGADFGGHDDGTLVTGDFLRLAPFLVCSLLTLVLQVTATVFSWTVTANLHPHRSHLS